MFSYSLLWSNSIIKAIYFYMTDCHRYYSSKNYITLSNIFKKRSSFWYMSFLIELWLFDFLSFSIWFHVEVRNLWTLINLTINLNIDPVWFVYISPLSHISSFIPVYLHIRTLPNRFNIQIAVECISHELSFCAGN